jgi:hypothetical protein
MKLAFFLVAAACFVQTITADPTTQCVIDLVFCIDNSASVGDYQPLGSPNPNWEKMLKFVQDLVLQLPVSPDETHVGAIDYGTYAYPEFDLNAHTTVSAVNGAVAKIQYRGESTNTTGGLYYSRRYLTESAFGPRGSEVPKVIILITDGNPNDQVETLDAEVANIRAAGIRVVGVGVTSGVSEDTMLRMVSSPSDYVQAQDFTQLDEIKHLVINDETCVQVTTPQPTPSPEDDCCC